MLKNVDYLKGIRKLMEGMPSRPRTKRSVEWAIVIGILFLFIMLIPFIWIALDKWLG